MNHKAYLKTYFVKLLLINILCLYITFFISPVGSFSQIVETTINILNLTEDISGGGQPLDFAVNSETNFIYVVRVGSIFNVTVIDGSTGELVKHINTQILFPGEIALNEITNRIYFANAEVIGYLVIDGITNEVIGGGPSGTIELCDPIPISTRALALDVNPRTNRIYLGATIVEDCKQLLIVDGLNNEIIDFILIEGIEDPTRIVINSQTNEIFVITSGPDFMSTAKSIIKIDGETNEIITSRRFNVSLSGIDIDPLTNNIYVGVISGDNHSVIVFDSNLESIISTIEVDDPFGGLKLNPATNHLFLAHHDSNTVSVIDTLTNDLVKTLEVGLAPGAIDINPISNRVYVLNRTDKSITVIKDGVDEAPLPTITPTPSPTPEVSPTPFPSPEVSPAPTQPSSTISVSPVMAKRSAKFNTAIVTVADKSGVGISGVRIKAVPKGLMTNVQPKIAVTDINGNAEFKFRFGLVSKDGQIVFTTEDGLTAVLSQEDWERK